MSAFAITGTSRGIGLELVKQLVALPEAQVSKVFAITRGSSAQLESIINSSNGRVINIVIDDLTNEESVQKGIAEVKKHSQSLDVLVNNAGIMSITPKGTRSVPAADLRKVLDVNLVGVQVITSAFLPLLEQGTDKKVINISTSMSSIAYAKRYAKHAPTHSYKISKAAMNMLTALYAEDHEDFTFVAVSPGWLATDLGSEHADLPVETGVASVKDIILRVDKTHSGKFLNIHVPGWENAKAPNVYDGKEVPW
ncbi:Putative short-chain dehydrogenase/reductase SDR, NAD(P)-binding domain superfamily [Septoria linicola]|uniref:Short-chain dehydrogenase/reductase SDR, NAD(P)-binding domain superfamily n=1 Tax=Septoria linicola TaxID=215465 RepID=A0A9Q9B6G8_9PEZI|nr:putative short-chain dehydrogenase/reductase SDR, NAD(P)-binding domain superfamily [Septoria linicola]USW58242.1 Putative short-chain dehydrogenase/reductase SDR, NAD(P)-binding domain superfamily [Septoria linicola]